MKLDERKVVVDPGASMLRQEQLVAQQQQQQWMRSRRSSRWILSPPSTSSPYKCITKGDGKGKGLLGDYKGKVKGPSLTGSAHCGKGGQLQQIARLCTLNRCRGTRPRILRRTTRQSAEFRFDVGFSDQATRRQHFANCARSQKFD